MADPIRLGVMVVASPLEVGAGEAAALGQRLQTALSAAAPGRLELVAAPQPVTDPPAAVAAGRCFYDQRVDALCLLASSWFEDYLVLDLLEECDAPLVLWSRPGMETGSLCGMQQLGYMLRALGRPFCAVFAEVGAGAALGRTLDYAAAAALRRRLRRSRLGLLGHRVDGMTETTGHELALKKVFGARIVGLDTALFLERAAAVPQAAVQARWQEVVGQVGQVNVSADTGLAALQKYVALEGVIEERGLSALALGCYPHLYGQVCLAVSLLNQEGMPVSCEGDINATLGMLLLSELAGEPVHFGEFLDPVPERNSVVFSHCGAGAFSLASSCSPITLAPIRLTDQGLCCLFTGRPGPCTLVGLGATLGSYRMNMLYGEAIETTMLYRGNPVEVRFRPDYRDIIAWVAEHGFAHHWVIAYGDLRRPLRDLATLTGCELISLE